MKDNLQTATSIGTAPKTGTRRNRHVKYPTARMSIRIFLILLFSMGTAHTEEIKTDYFSIIFPEPMLVEAGPGRILVSGPNGPYEPPLQFISIEYVGNDEVGLEMLIEDANHTLGQAKEGAVVEQVDCANDCAAYFGSVEQSESAMKVHSYFYVIRGNNISAAISGGFEGDYDEAKNLLDDIAGQIIAGRI